MIKQIRTSVEGEIRFEAEYDQGRGDWRDFQKEFYDSSDCKYFLSDVQSHHQSLDLGLCGIKCAVLDNGILFMVYDTKWYMIYHLVPYIIYGIYCKANCYFFMIIKKYLTMIARIVWLKVTVRIRIFGRPTVRVMFNLCYDVINRCKLWKTIKDAFLFINLALKRVTSP